MANERAPIDPEVVEENGLRALAQMYKDQWIMPENHNRPPTWQLVKRLSEIILKLLDRLADKRRGADAIKNESIEHP